MRSMESPSNFVVKLILRLSYFSVKAYNSFSRYIITDDRQTDDTLLTTAEPTSIRVLYRTLEADVLFTALSHGQCRDLDEANTLWVV